MPTGISSQRQLAAIMFADIVGYTAMMQEDENRARTLRDRHRDVIEEMINAHAGEIIQYYGDGTLSIFKSAKEAVLAAAEIQQTLRKPPEVPLRIGIHVGDIVRDEGGIFGDGVNLAARIESVAIPGAVLFSDKVCSELENHPAIRCVSLGEFQFKNVRKPVGVFALDHADIVVPGRGDLAPGKQEAITRSIAILPFDIISGSQDSDYFAHGVSEEIVNGLTKVNGISTISRTTCLTIKQNRADLSSFRDRLKVSHILEGTVRTAGNRVRVSVQLVNAADEYQLWSEVIEKDLDDIFRVQDEIAHHVVQALKVRFEPPTEASPIVAKPTGDMEAYKLYLKGVHQLEKNIPDECFKAVEHLRQAISLDPEFATARCALSNCYAFLGSCGAMEPLEAFNSAHRYALDAIERNPKSAEAHLAMAVLKFYHFWDWKGTHESLEKASRLGLNSALLHQTYGLYCAATGQLKLGIEKMRKALELDPLSIMVLDMLGTLYLFDEQYEKALPIFDEILELRPAHRSAHEGKGVTLICQGHTEAALEQFELYHQKVNKHDRGLIGMAIAHHKLGNVDRTNEYLQRLHDRFEREKSPAVEIDLGVIYCSIGEYEKGVAYLNRVYANRFSIACLGMIWVVRCPWFSHLWGRADFLELLDKMGLEPTGNIEY